MKNQMTVTINTEKKMEYVSLALMNGYIPISLEQKDRDVLKKYKVKKTQKGKLVRWHVRRSVRIIFISFSVRVSKDFLAKETAYKKLISIAGLEDTLLTIANFVKADY